MLAKNVVSLWARSGLVWLLFTMLFGMYLGITGQFGISSPHAHAGLLGGLWAIGFSYLFNRADGDKNIRFAFWQWLLFNLGVACHMTALWMVLMVDPKWGILIGLGGGTITLTTIWIVLVLWPALQGDEN